MTSIDIYILINKMGDTNSQPGNRQPTSIQEDEDLHILDDPAQLSLACFIHYWIDPKIFNVENQKYESYLRQLLNIEGLSSIEGLNNTLNSATSDLRVKIISAASLQDDDYKWLQSNDQIEEVVLFCRNQERAKLLMGNFLKIKQAKFDIKSLRACLVEAEQSLSFNNVLFLIEDDTQLLNKYRINFHALVCAHDRVKGKEDYLIFLRQLYGSHKQEIDRFEKEYKLDLPPDFTHQQVLDWAFKSKLFWESLQAMPKITTNPKVLAYLRFAYKELYEAIRKKYTRQTGEAYLVLPLTDKEVEKLKQNTDNYLIFPSFVRAYSNEKAAQAEFKKKPNNFMIRIILPALHRNNSIGELDFGFYKAKKSGEQPDIIFNIYNFFLINDFEPEMREVILSYGSLAEVAYSRQNRRQIHQFTEKKENLMRNFDYWEDITSNIDSQAAVLQLYGYTRESLKAWNKKYDSIQRSQPSQDEIDKIAIEVGDAYKMDEQYKEAECRYRQIKEGSKNYFKALVHLANLYIKTEQKLSLDETIEKLEANMSKYEKQNRVESFRAKDCIGMKLMHQGEYRAAGHLYKNLVRQINDYYDYKYESIPLVHEIYRNRATCETKLNNFAEALSLLNSTFTWQKACEGTKSPGLLKTERQITQIRETQSLKQVSAEKKSAHPKKLVSLPQNLNESPVNVELGKSMPSQVTLKPKNSTKSGAPKKLIEQSQFMKIDDDL